MAVPLVVSINIGQDHTMIYKLKLLKAFKLAQVAVIDTFRAFNQRPFASGCQFIDTAFGAFYQPCLAQIVAAQATRLYISALRLLGVSSLRSSSLRLYRSLRPSTSWRNVIEPMPKGSSIAASVFGNPGSAFHVLWRVSSQYTDIYVSKKHQNQSISVVLFGWIHGRSRSRLISVGGEVLQQRGRKICVISGICV